MHVLGSSLSTPRYRPLRNAHTCASKEITKEGQLDGSVG